MYQLELCDNDNIMETGLKASKLKIKPFKKCYLKLENIVKSYLIILH